MVIILLCVINWNIVIVGVTVEPHRKQLHITLAHQYRPDHQTALEALCRKINPTAPSSWELRLYSRDQRLATAEVSCHSDITQISAHHRYIE